MSFSGFVDHLDTIYFIYCHSTVYKSKSILCSTLFNIKIILCLVLVCHETNVLASLAIPWGGRAV